MANHVSGHAYAPCTELLQRSMANADTAGVCNVACLPPGVSDAQAAAEAEAFKGPGPGACHENSVKVWKNSSIRSVYLR